MSSKQSLEPDKQPEQLATVNHSVYLPPPHSGTARALLSLLPLEVWTPKGQQFLTEAERCNGRRAH